MGVEKSKMEYNLEKKSIERELSKLIERTLEMENEINRLVLSD